MDKFDLILKIVVSILAIISTTLSIIAHFKVKKLEKQLSTAVSGKNNKTITSGDSSNNVIGNKNNISKEDK